MEMNTLSMLETPPSIIWHITHIFDYREKLYATQQVCTCEYFTTAHAHLQKSYWFSVANELQRDETYSDGFHKH